MVSVYYQPSLSGESDNGLVVYPNPSGYNFSVTIKEPAEKVTFTLFDTKGELILTDTLNADVENYTFPVQLQNVPSGVYYIKAEIGDKVHKAKQLILVGN